MKPIVRIPLREERTDRHDRDLRNLQSYLEQELRRGGTRCFSEETRLVNALTKIDGTTPTLQPSPPALASDAVQLPADPPDDIR
jgi:hypothetical protein